MIMQNEFVYNPGFGEFYCKLVDNGNMVGVTVSSTGRSIRRWDYIPFIAEVEKMGLLNALLSHDKSISYRVVETLPEIVYKALVANGYKVESNKPSDFELAARFKYKETKYLIT